MLRRLMVLAVLAGGFVIADTQPAEAYRRFYRPRPVARVVTAPVRRRVYYRPYVARPRVVVGVGVGVGVGHPGYYW
ncbi:MAG: hypothetical protein AAGA92_11520 [Planctomycetota bacterium]